MLMELWCGEGRGKQVLTLSFQPGGDLECSGLGECAELWAVSLVRGDPHQGDFQGQTPWYFPAPGGLWHQGGLASAAVVSELCFSSLCSKVLKRLLG